MPELNQIMYVIKRNGIKEEVQFDKVQGRIRNLSSNLNINSALVAQRVCSRIYDGVRTHELDELASQICTSMSTENTDYGKLAHRIVISNNHKLTNPDFFETISQLYHYNASMISKELFEFIELNKEIIQETINYKLDYNFDFFGFKTLEKAYLLKIDGKTAERIQHMIMRVSCGLHIGDIESALNSYKFMSQKYFTHATPTLFHSGTKKSQLLSCFLIGTHDSINGIFKTISDCAKISQLAGGIGVHIDNIRSQGSYIRGTNGKSQGIIPMLRVYNDTAKYVNQGGKRNGSIAIYLEPHHPDILDFLDLRKNHGNEDQRCRDLFTALMISDLFMRKLEEALTGGEEFEWAFFDPDTTPGLGDCYGEEYERLYFKYLEEGKYVSRVPILKLWRKIISSQVETGTPYILYKDQMNRTSNQKNIGIIKSSNLCAEIAEYSDDKEYACCCLASISLSSMIKEKNFTNQPIKIFSKTDCKYCRAAKKALPHYEEIVLDNKDERVMLYSELSKKLGKEINSVPQIFIKRNGQVPDTEYIGGYKELKEYMKPTFDFDMLKETCKVLVRNLNRVVDLNFYPVPETKRSNYRHRPLGIGIQGFADMLFKLRYPFESKEAREINKEIFENIYYACLEESMNIAKKRYQLMQTEEFFIWATQLNEKYQNIECDPDLIQEPYQTERFTLKEVQIYLENRLDPHLRNFVGAYTTFIGSPLYQGKFSFDLHEKESQYISSEKWEELRTQVQTYGVRNSLLTALMPTASTSQILGNNECFEPITSNIYTRRTLAGDFIVVNNYLLNDLMELELWDKDMKQLIIAENGSIQNIDCIPNNIKELYKTTWEIKQKSVIDLAADRAPFICQTQSMNLFFNEPNQTLLSSALLYGWKRGLKTGSYYVRSQPKVQAQQFTIDPNLRKLRKKNVETEHEVCESCSG